MATELTGHRAEASVTSTTYIAPQQVDNTTSSI